MLRRQLPVHSPVTWGALAAGAAASVRGDRDGGLHERLVERLQARYGARDVLLTDSGTTALRLAIAGAVADRGSPVAIPGYTCYDMATAAEGADAGVVLYDIDPATLGPDPASIVSVLAERPAAVVVGHLFGHLVDVASVAEQIGGTLLIEDAAQGVGGTLAGRPLGSWGSLSVLSFGRGKGLTGGGGGAVLALDDRGVEALARVRGQHDLTRAPRGASRVAILAAQLVLGRPALFGIPSALPFLHLGETIYHPPQPPEPASVASLAVLERVMPVADSALPLRTNNAKRLIEALARSIRLRAMKSVPGGEPGYLRLPALVDGGAARAMLLGSGAGRIGIANGYPTTLAALPSLAGRIVGPAPRLPGAEALADSLITLPTHGLLTESDLSAIEDWVTGRTASGVGRSV